MNAFKKNPFGTIKKILCSTPVGELKCTKEELDAHLRIHVQGSASLEFGGKSHRKSFPTVPVREHDAVIKKARSNSAPGNNGISYMVYKRSGAPPWSLGKPLVH